MGWNEEDEEVVFRVTKGDVWRTNGKEGKKEWE